MSLDYFKGDEFAYKVWKEKYGDNENSPINTFMRMAKEFGRVRFNKDKSKTLEQWVEYFYDLFSSYISIPQGRVEAGLGRKDSYRSLSNCLRLPSPKDSYSDIMRIDTMLVSAAKRGCGYGTGLSNLRPYGSSTTNSAKTSTGVIPFGERYSNSTKEVGQEGRRGACLIDLDIRHPDAIEWAMVKLDKTKYTGANISFKMWNDFMEAVEKDEDYILRFPCDLKTPLLDEHLEYDILINYSNVGYVKRIKAKELWNKAIHTVWSDGCPGMQFWERMLNYDPASIYEKYKPTGTNACQPDFSRVLTKEGIRELKDINIGDFIWGGKDWVKVINKWSNGVKNVYKYNTSTGYFLGTEDHKILENGEKVEIKDASSIDWNIGKIEGDFEIDASIVIDGLVIGDGTVHKASNNLVLLCIGKKDYDYFDSEISTFILKHRPGIKEGMWEINTNIQFEELPKTYDRIIPDRYFYGDVKTKLSFLRGLFSANGSIAGNRITLKQSSKVLIEQVREMLSSIGICSYITKNIGKEVKFSNGIYKCRDSYDLNITSGRTIFKKYIGFIQKYKNEKIIDGNNPKYLTSSIIDIEDIGLHEVFDMTVDSEEHTYWTGGVLVSNCGEQNMTDFDTCRLLTQSLMKVIDNPFTEKASLNKERLYNNSYILIEIGDDLVDLEIEYIQRIIDKIKSDEEEDSIKAIELELWVNVKNMAESGRRIGCGITALADMLAAMNLKYDTEEAILFVDEVMRIKMEAELDSTINLAKKYGTFKGWNPNLEKDGNDWYKFIEKEFPKQWIEMQKYGRRNVNFNTIAPVGTKSITIPCIEYFNTSSGCEPQFSLWYFRNKKVEKKEDPCDFIDEVGIRWKQYPVIMGGFKDYLKIKYNITEFNNLTKEQLETYYKESPYFNALANDIDWINRVKMQAVLQKYTTSSISSTINLPKTVKEEVISQIYIEAWKNGLKGITCYRDGSKGNVLTREANINKFGYNNAVKRPKDLEADYYNITVKGQNYGVIVGLYDNNPYEIFAIENGEHTDKKVKGKLIKVKKGTYRFESSIFVIENLQFLGKSDERLLTRWVSMALRHGTDPKHICEQIDRSEIEVVSFTKALQRVIKKYIKNEETLDNCPECGEKMIYEEGCKKCSNCGYSKC